MENWNNFIREFTAQISPIYQKHENTFDVVGVHGRLHIARSIIFSEFMARFHYNELNNKDIDFSAIRYAVSFHDSGRQANGIDLWENDSMNLCSNYLEKKGYGLNFCKYSSSLINKKLNLDINKIIVYDADVLEIMRPCCGHGERDGFRSNFLNFLNSFSGEGLHNVRLSLIEDAWKLIEYSEDNKHLFSNNHLIRLIDFIKKGDFVVLNNYF